MFCSFFDDIYELSEKLQKKPMPTERCFATRDGEFPDHSEKSFSVNQSPISNESIPERFLSGLTISSEQRNYQICEDKAATNGTHQVRYVAEFKLSADTIRRKITEFKNASFSSSPYLRDPKNSKRPTAEEIKKELLDSMVKLYKETLINDKWTRTEIAIKEGLLSCFSFNHGT